MEEIDFWEAPGNQELGLFLNVAFAVLNMHTKNVSKCYCCANASRGNRFDGFYKIDRLSRKM